MKIQYIAIIFIIIIIPIALATSSYINSQIDTITLQTEYNTKLSNATYDAVKAFQINTVNNRYSSVSDSKIRDIEASINTFFNSLSSTENIIEEELQNCIPALVYTLYDGYYICSKYDNVYYDESSKIGINDGKPQLDDEALKKDGYAQYGLKPYIYYSCRYISGNKNFVVNYTLDNAITVYGKFGSDYKTLSGYLIDPESVKIIFYNADENIKIWKLTYSNVEITPEVLTEHLLFADKQEGDYNYLVYNGQKVYFDSKHVETGRETKYFWYKNYAKTYINKNSADKANMGMIKYLTSRTYKDSDNIEKLHSTSAFEYYYNAKVFTQEINNLLGNITQADAVDEVGNGNVKFSINTKNENIFPINEDNNPLLSGSTFDEHRRAVIRKSIETNLTAAIANYNIYSSNTYEFSLPVLSEIDWDKITNNISVISFLQGIPIGHKYYNNYCVITNNNNEETVKKENIYIITQNSSGEREYHLPGCKHLLEASNNTSEAYSNISFLRQTVRISEGDYLYFYPQTRDDANITACYDCIVSASEIYDIDDIINGKILYDINNLNFKRIRDIYIKALARERYDLYQTNMELENWIQISNIDDDLNNTQKVKVSRVDMPEFLTIYIGSNPNIEAPTNLNAKIVNSNNTTSNDLEWSSTNTSVATVNNGKISPKSLGTTIITAKAKNGSEYAECEVTVKRRIDSIRLENLALDKGENAKISITITPQNADTSSLEWSIEDGKNDVADIIYGIVYAKTAGTEKIRVKANDGGNATATCTVTVNEKSINAANISLDKGKVTLEKNGKIKLTATVFPSGATENLKWTSSDSTVATVDQYGNILALNNGITVVTVTATNNDGTQISATCVVNVETKMTEIKLDPNEIDLTIGESYQFAQNKNIKITPTNATRKIIEWTSDDASIAYVDDTGKIIAVGVGTTYVTAFTKDGSNKTATCKVNVKEKAIEGITLNKTKATLVIRAGLQLIATVTPNDATNTALTWESSNNNIITVDSNGFARAKGIGSATITVKNKNGKTAQCTITVIEDNIQGNDIIISPAILTLVPGQSKKLQAKVVDIEGNELEETVTWRSSDKEIVKVEGDGKITALKECKVDKEQITPIYIYASIDNGRSVSGDKITIEEKCKVYVETPREEQFLADIVQPGDYVQYSANGYELWRVMKVEPFVYVPSIPNIADIDPAILENSLEGITIVPQYFKGGLAQVVLISEGIVGTKTFDYIGLKQGNSSYNEDMNNYMTELNDECQKYISTYGEFARVVGSTAYNSQSQYSGGKNNEYYNSYNGDIGILRNIENSGVDGMLDCGEDYWIGYGKLEGRTIYYPTPFGITESTRYNKTAYYFDTSITDVNSYTWDWPYTSYYPVQNPIYDETKDAKIEKGVRVVVNLQSGVKTSYGDGTKENPYNISSRQIVFPW